MIRFKRFNLALLVAYLHLPVQGPSSFEYKDVQLEIFSHVRVLSCPWIICLLISIAPQMN